MEICSTVEHFNFNGTVRLISTLRVKTPETNGYARGLTEEEVSVDFNETGLYNRQSGYAVYEENICQIWDELSNQNPRIFDGSKFRLFDQEVSSDGLNFKIGLTSYRELLGTHHCSALKDAFKDNEGLKNVMSNAIGVGAIVETSDGRIPLLKRAEWTGEWPGMIDRPGGHPEPDNLSSNPSNIEVLQEIFESPRKELRDEVNVSLDNQSQAYLLGIIFDMEAGGRVGLDFYVKIDISGEQLESEYQEGHQIEADESTKMIFVDKKDVKEWKISESLLSQMTPHCKGGLRLFHRMLNS